MSYAALFGGWLVWAILLFESATGIALADPLGRAIDRAPYEEARDNPSRTEQSRPAPTPKQSPKPAYIADYQSTCNKPRTLEASSLCQQWRMATASEDLVDLTDWQLRFTLIGSMALVIALFFTAYAARAAGRAAYAAMGSLELSRRGYLFPQSVGIRKATFRYSDGTPDENVFLFDVQFRNVGVAPSRISRIVKSRRLIEANIDPNDIDWSLNVPEEQWQTTVGPSGEWQVPEIDLSVREAKLGFSKESQFFVRVRVEYKSVFENKSSYHTEQGFEVLIGTEPENLYANVPNLKDYIFFQAYHPISSAS